MKLLADIPELNTYLDGVPVEAMNGLEVDEHSPYEVHVRQDRDALFVFFGKSVRDLVGLSMSKYHISISQHDEGHIAGPSAEEAINAHKIIDHTSPFSAGVYKSPRSKDRDMLVINVNHRGGVKTSYYMNLKGNYLSYER